MAFEEGDIFANLDRSKLHETKKNKNRSTLLIIDRENYNLDKITRQISDMLTDLLEDRIDSITIDVKRRTW